MYSSAFLVCTGIRFKFKNNLTQENTMQNINVGMQVLTSTLERVILSDDEEDEDEDADKGEDEDEDEDDDDATKKGFLLILWLPSGCCCSSLVCESVTLVIFVVEAAVKYEGGKDTMTGRTVWISYVLKSTFKLMAYI
uniref:Uncharacterized protein n=1 Tax=Glossina austeni TaxID=7395 RepID=A0A1A9UZ68_GLOAU